MLTDLKLAFRLLVKSPAFTIIASLTLAIGIGANTALFSIVNGVLLHPLPYPHPDELVVLHASKQNFPEGSISYPNFRDWKRNNHTFSAMAVSRGYAFNLTGRGVAEQVAAQFVTADFFPIFGVQPLQGRLPTAEEDEPGAAPVALISEGFWRRKLETSPTAIGQVLTLDGRNYTIIGIVPASFRPPLRNFGVNDVYVPLAQWANPQLNQRTAGLGIHGIGRLKPGVALEQAQADMAMVTRDLAREYPDANKGIGARVVPLITAAIGSVRPFLLMLFGAVGFVLLIACANVASLLLSRAIARRREFAVRIALGASRASLARQLVAESLLLALVSGVGGLLIAWWGTHATVAAMPGALPRAAEVQIDSRALLFTLVVSLACGLIFGLAPALRSARADVQDTLKQGSRGSTSGSHRTLAGFAIGQTALAVILLVGAGLMIRTLVRLWKVDPGFQPANVMTFAVGFPPEAVNWSVDSVREANRQLRNSLGSSPGVVAASLSWAALPMSGDDEQLFWPMSQARPTSPDDMLWALRYIVDPAYLQVMRIPLQRGRFFVAADDEHAPVVAVIDEVFAHKFFPNRDPIGEKLNLDGYDRPVEIVGVVGHVNQWGLDRDESQALRAELYLSFMQMPEASMKQTASGVACVVRSDGIVPDVLAGIRQASARMSRDQIVFGAQTMNSIIDGSLAVRRFTMVLFAAFAVAALVLASIGIYGVLSYLVVQRRQEIGIRVALGASPAAITRLVVSNGTRLAATGIGIGVAGALMLTDLISTLLYGVSPLDPLTFGSVAALLFGVALLASWLPARRALKVSPIEALRTE